MGLVLQYKIKEGVIPDKETIAVCDRGREGMQSLLVTSAKIAFPKMTWIMWILSRFYIRKITKESISYNFYLFPSDKKKKKNSNKELL